jgi:hypothetical protein
MPRAIMGGCFAGSLLCCKDSIGFNFAQMKSFPDSSHLIDLQRLLAPSTRTKRTPQGVETHVQEGNYTGLQVSYIF